MINFAKLDTKPAMIGSSTAKNSFCREPGKVETGKWFCWEGAPEQQEENWPDVILVDYS
jgi:hypothetical protein